MPLHRPRPRPLALAGSLLACCALAACGGATTPTGVAARARAELRLGVRSTAPTGALRSRSSAFAPVYPAVRGQELRAGLTRVAACLRREHIDVGRHDTDGSALALSLDGIASVSPRDRGAVKACLLTAAAPDGPFDGTARQPTHPS